MNILNVMILPRRGRIIALLVFAVYFTGVALLYLDGERGVHLPKFLGTLEIICLISGAIIIPCVVGAKYQQLGLGCIVPTAAASADTALSVSVVGFFMLAIQAAIIYAKGLIIMLTCVIRFIFTYIYKVVMIMIFRSYCRQQKNSSAIDIAMKLYAYELLTDRSLSRMSSKYFSDVLAKPYEIIK